MINCTIILLINYNAKRLSNDKYNFDKRIICFIVMLYYIFNKINNSKIIEILIKKYIYIHTYIIYMYI